MPITAACQTTHPQILAGKCLRCDETIGSDSHASAIEPGKLLWNIPRMEEDLSHEDDEVRYTTLKNVNLRLFDIDEAFGLLRKAIGDPLDRLREDAETRLSILGGKLSPDEAERFKEGCRQSPDDLSLRILLLGFLFHPRRSPDERIAHIFWMIRNAARCSVAGSPHAGVYPHTDIEAFVEAKRLWLAQVEAHPEDTKILGNAARFLTLSHKEMTENLLQRAKSLEPHNPDWPHRLGHLYSLQGRGGDDESRREWATKSLVEFEREQELRGDEQERLSRLHDLAWAAFDAAEYTKARVYAARMLDKVQSGTNRGMAIFHGNQVLGRVALVEGDIEGAKHHLLESAKTPGSPTLGSFGPGMELARDLLAIGEQDAVLSYLRSCLSFWGMGQERLEGWIFMVERGVTPDFECRC